MKRPFLTATISFGRLLLFIFKAYILILPAVLVFLEIIRQSPLTIYGVDRLTSRILAAENAETFIKFECGYIICVLGLLIGCVIAFKRCDNKAMKSEIIFIIMGIISFIFFLPVTGFLYQTR